MFIRLTSALLVASVAAGACGREGPPQKPAAAANAPAAGDLKTVPETGLGAFLPSSGWTRSKPSQPYSADNLWEFIDGAADTYVSYGVQQALGAGFRQAGADVDVEIYDMGDALHAFGIYAQELPPSPQFVDAGAEGYTHGNVLRFWKGAYYVKLTSSAAAQPGPAGLTALAKGIAGKMPAGAALPGELSAFPAKNLVPNSKRFVPKDVLGQRSLGNGFEASYQDGAAVSRLVVVPFASPTDAAEAFARYRAFVSGGGTVPPGAADEAFSGDDRFSGRVFAARAGATMAISLGAQAEAAAASLVGEYLRAARGQDKR
jgi:predicted small lipoprotein YifL